MAVNVIHDIDVATKILAAVFCIIFAGYFWKRRQKAEMKSTRMIFLSQGLFVLCFGITRLIFLASDYFSPYVDISLVIYQDEALYFTLWKISTLIGILAIIFLLVVIETYLVKSRYILTGTASVGLIVALLSMDQDFSRLVTYVTLPIAMFGVIFLYAYLFFKGSGDIRKKAGLSLDGFIIFGIGVILDTTVGKELLEGWGIPLPAFIPVMIMIIGLAIYTYFNIKE
ncbi:MAG TPA: hypothetical protein VMV49_09760 [Candidatus Deferrimicrobium sp.]|nr:hypothetical protein [Candidatus Deferrimicrobium sp.]